MLTRLEQSRPPSDHVVGPESYQVDEGRSHAHAVGLEGGQEFPDEQFRQLLLCGIAKNDRAENLTGSFDVRDGCLDGKLLAVGAHVGPPFRWTLP